MDPRDCLVKAQEAEVHASGCAEPSERRAWENIAKEYRRLAEAVAAVEGRLSPASAPPPR
jgi:hypothetical protein